MQLFSIPLTLTWFIYLATAHPRELRGVPSEICNIYTRTNKDSTRPRIVKTLFHRVPYSEISRPSFDLRIGHLAFSVYYVLLQDVSLIRDEVTKFYHPTRNPTVFLPDKLRA